jgi:hypothetical protein
VVLQLLMPWVHPSRDKRLCFSIAKRTVGAAGSVDRAAWTGQAR